MEKRSVEKKNLEDAMTYLERLKHTNMLNQAANLPFVE